MEMTLRYRSDATADDSVASTPSYDDRCQRGIHASATEKEEHEIYLRSPRTRRGTTSSSAISGVLGRLACCFGF